MLIGKLLAAITVKDAAEKGVRKVEKKVSKKMKKVRRVLTVIALAFAFVAGCSLTGYIVYKNSDRIAAHVRKRNRRARIRRIFRKKTV
ncbi:MAG: hypothetical protein IJV40_00300 [Oscillospiraceae bacterium]|nr:hypothetical protein [Oscillospiraceae bacterium]